MDPTPISPVPIPSPSPAPAPTTGDLSVIVDSLLNAREGNLISVAFWKNILTNVLAIALTVLAFFHPGYHLPANLQALIDTVIPAVSIVAVAMANTFFAHSAHQVRQTQLVMATENRRLSVESQRLALDHYALSLQNRPGPQTPLGPHLGDSGEPITPTTP